MNMLRLTKLMFFKKTGILLGFVVVDVVFRQWRKWSLDFFFFL